MSLQVSVELFYFVQKGSLGASCVQPATAAHTACYCFWDPFCALEHLKCCCG